MVATKMVFHHMVLIFHSIKDLDLDMQIFQIWKTSRLEDFQTTSRKSSDGIFSHMVLIFHLDMYFVCFIKVCLSNFPLIFFVLNSFEHFGRPMGILLEILLKYNVLEDFQEVFQTTSRKSLTGSSSISSGV
ncbi:hypothetical protein IGI04_015602 [Brassica rapa subsp. trilocularis]|uniref:Uncharacterized protein n=1 Tax=Brassica rapa subsp. trilocularis TaxID=1813537 RepID=A0ABQ7MQJ8_BRACM|nr:hypothetical protein IGI04_015602 [Brassica rapa subsp. trilocularis]